MHNFFAALVVLLALLDSETRRHMRAVSAVGQMEISAGRIEAVISKDGLLSDTLPSLLAEGGQLSLAHDPAGQLSLDTEADS